MKVLKDLVAKAHDTMDEVEWYAEKALHLKATHKPLSETYIKIAEMHIDIYKHLHQRIVSIIEDEKKKGNEIPPIMDTIYEYEHEKLVKEFAKAKVLIDEYNKSY